MYSSMQENRFAVWATVLLTAGCIQAVARGESVLSDGVLSATLSEQGTIQDMTWNRPGTSPVSMAFRHDQYAGFAWHVCVGGQWRVQLPLERVKSGASDFAAILDGIVYSLAYAV